MLENLIKNKVAFAKRSNKKVGCQTPPSKKGEKSENVTKTLTFLNCSKMCLSKYLVTFWGFRLQTRLTTAQFSSFYMYDNIIDMLLEQNVPIILQGGSKNYTVVSCDFIICSR